MSPAGLQQSADFQTFFLHALAMITDHANDQKKLKQLFQELNIHYDHEVYGEHVLLLLSPCGPVRTGPVTAQNCSGLVL